MIKRKRVPKETKERESWYGSIGFELTAKNETEMSLVLDQLCDFLKTKGKSRQLKIEDWDARRKTQ